jgi:hypothetical protein
MKIENLKIATEQENNSFKIGFYLNTTIGKDVKSFKAEVKAFATKHNIKANTQNFINRSLEKKYNFNADEFVKSLYKELLTDKEFIALFDKKTTATKQPTKKELLAENELLKKQLKKW